MNYRDKVLNYFKFSSDLIVQIGNKQKKSVSISGKPKKRMIIFFLIFISVFYIISIIANIPIHSTNQNSSINHTNLIIAIITPIISTILVFIKSKKLFKKVESKPTNINIYQRELPNQLKPTHVRMLLNDGLIDETSIASTILDLIDNGYLEISRTKSKLDIFNDNNIILTKTNKDQNNLLQYEKFLLKWFIDECGDGIKVTSNEIKKSLTSNNNSNITPSYLFEHFQALVIISFPLYKYYSKRNISHKKVLYNIMLFIGFMLLTTPIGASILIYGLGTIMFASPQYILTKEGTEEEDKWLDLMKYLKDFGAIQNKTPEMIVLWEYYLTNSVAFGIDSIAKEEIESFFGKEIYNGNIQTENNSSIINSITDNNEIEQNIEQEKIKYQQIIGLK